MMDLEQLKTHSMDQQSSDIKILSCEVQLHSNRKKAPNQGVSVFKYVGKLKCEEKLSVCVKMFDTCKENCQTPWKKYTTRTTVTVFSRHHLHVLLQLCVPVYSMCV